MIYRLRPLLGYAVASALVFLATGVIALVRLEVDAANIAMLYLFVVLAVAVLYGMGPAIAASIAAFLAFNFFFVEPRYTFSVADEEELLSLLLLLATGIVTGRLAAALRDRAREAESREREAVILYDVVRLMGEPDLQRALTSVAERLRVELDQSAVTISFGRDHAIRAQVDSGDPESLKLARDALGLPDLLLAKGADPTADSRGQTGRWIKVMPPTRRSIPGSERARRVPITLAEHEGGALVLVAAKGASPFNREEDRLLSVAANQLGLTFERLRLQREANEAEVLRRTDELRTALMNAVSHDLRTPLSSIIASAGSLLQEEVEWTDDERREFLQAIEGEAERLNRLVSNLLDLSRIEAGSIKPEKGWYDLGSLVNEVAGRLRFVAASHQLKVEVPENLPPLEFDYVEIDQVLTNLIENAIKYTPPGTAITISVRPDNGIMEVEVTDNGPGIPPDSLPRLFDAFYRAPATVAKPQGSGLGLAVARGLVEAHGGHIRAENRPGGGASFTFSLPLSERIAEPAEQGQPA